MNTKQVTFAVIFIPLIAAGIWAWKHVVPEQIKEPGDPAALQENIREVREDLTGDQTKEAEKEWVTETVAEGLVVPWSMAFTADNRMLVTERPGRIRAIVDGKLLEKPLYTFSDVTAVGEGGAMGIAIDPHYNENKYVYISLTYGSPAQNKVVRLKDNGDSLSEPTMIIDKIPGARNHNGSRVKFGPDQKLYITTGDATDRSIAQDQKNLGGKILRLNSDGSIPEDNPFEGSPIYSYGHRNPQGIAWDPYTGEMYATEHGPSAFDGPRGGDEINHIMPGANYGWPLVSHENKQEGTEEPILLFTPAIAPAGAAFYSSDKIPQFTGKMFWTALRGEGIFMGTLDGEDPGDFDDHEKLPIEFGRIRDIIEGPDGALYFATSNRDTRGDPRPGDDKIVRIRVKE